MTEPRTGRWRAAVVVVLIVVAAVLAPLAVVARWAHDLAGDTERYVATVAPLAEDPDVQAALSDRVATEIVARLPVEQLTDRAIEALVGRGLGRPGETALRGLAAPLAAAVESMVEDQTTALVESERFAELWAEAQRGAHAQVVALLTGDGSDLMRVDADTVTLDLAPVTAEVRQRLVDRGLAIAERLPTVEAELEILHSPALAQAQTAFRVLEALRVWLPVATLLCLAAAIVLARSRRRAVIAGALAIALSMVLLAVGLGVFREAYLDAVPAEQLPSAAAGAIFDAVAWPLRLRLRTLLVVAMLVATGAGAVGAVRGRRT